jgi:hypothetical protein
MLITAHQLATKVKELREEQKKYFKTKDPVILIKCKQLEKQVDTVVESVLSFQVPVTGNLFKQD